MELNFCVIIFHNLIEGSLLTFDLSNNTNMGEIGDLCKRCKKETTSLASRNDTFCEGCFIRFIRGKQRKQMQDEKFKVKFRADQDKPKLLLDLKNDHESYVLLDIMLSMLAEQLTHGPKANVGFELVVAVINDCKKGYQVDVSKIKELYTTEELERLGITFIEVNVDDFITNNKLENLKLDLQNFQTFVSDGIKGSAIKTYQELLNQIADKTTREDVSRVIHDDLIISTAQENQCSIVVKPHSMTQMAVEILTDSISGRGAEIPIKSQDAYIGTFDIIHPLRDILYSEIRMYANIIKLNELSPVLKISSSISDVSTKSKSVHTMVTEYFQTLETEYPEVVSTVVKIGAKLGNPSGKPESRCEMCKTPIYHDPKAWLEQITVDGFVPPQNEEEEANLKRYLESIVDVDEETVDVEQTETKLCYGCMVTLGVSQVKDLQWPQRPSREEILAEYILTDDDE